MGRMFCRRHLCLGKKRGEAVGKTKRGKGTKIMAVNDGQGIPMAALLSSLENRADDGMDTKFPSSGRSL